jgi:thioredoxin:protein disulfide reductase
MRTLLLILLLFGHSPVFAMAAKPVVTVKIIKPTEPLIPGKPAKLTVEFDIASPYHINSDRPLDEFLHPTKVKFDSMPGVQFGKVAFPQAEMRKLLSMNLAVFEGSMKAVVDITPSADLKEKEIDVRGMVHYQACNDSVCLSPMDAPIHIKLPVDLSKPVAVASRAPGGAVKPGSAFEDKSIFGLFLLVFVGGLALNLTPCVYPMIPITITYFGGQARGNKSGLFAHALLYTIGMAVTYSILGVIAAMTGGFLGEALRYPAVLIGISCIMTLLAMSMFDVYEFRLPAFVNRLAGGSQKGFTGTFLMGLTVGIVAAPCIGPFVLALLTYVGDKGSVFLGFSLFFVLALGLGIPFLVLGVFSGSINRLPKSGSWMVWVRKIFGFVLLAMAIHFLKTLFPNPLLYQLTFSATMFLAGIYAAWIEPTQSEGKVFPFIRNVAGIVFFAVAIYAAAAGLQDQAANRVVNPARSGERSLSENDENSIQWLAYSDELMSQASRQTKPVFIDFYADWCAPCKELDRYTYAAPEVVSFAKNFIMIKADLTSADDPRIERLREKYQARGVPTLAFLKPNGEEMRDLRATGFEPKEAFLLRMKQALRKAASPPAELN